MLDQVNVSRQIETLVQGRSTSDGDGVRLVRVLTGNLQRRLDPFLMLDAFANENPDDYIGGFPDHPHRGFETITYMIAGRMRHRDSAGNEGLLQNGGMQWMVAGRGVIHSEMPEQEDGLMEGFQLWLNLPASDKMIAPWYRDFPVASIPRVEPVPGVEVGVLAGVCHGVAGAMERQTTEPLYLDVNIKHAGEFSQRLPAGHNAFLYVYRGSVRVGESLVPRGHMAILSNSATADGVLVKADEAARFLLLAGKPLNEPIAQYGPFVMNTEAQLQQAIEDYRQGVLAN